MLALSYFLPLFFVLAFWNCDANLMKSKADDIPMSSYIDSVSGSTLQYPQGWTFTEKKTESSGHRQRNFYFTPMHDNGNLRVNFKVTEAINIAPRSLAQFKSEYLETILKPDPDYHLNDSGESFLSAEPAFKTVYSFSMNGKPYLKLAEIICEHNNRDYSFTFEATAADYSSQVPIFEKMLTGFRFDR